MVPIAIDQPLPHAMQSDPGIALTVPVQRLYGTPKIIHGEAFSSWLYRVCCHHRIKLASLLNLMKLPETSDYLDFGGVVSLDSIFHIAALTLNSPAAIMSAVSPPMHLLSNGAFRCLTFDLATVTPIYRVCIPCLMEGDVPHIRRVWRLAYSLVCTRHRHPLIGCCPKCSRPFDFSRDRLLDRPNPERTATIRYCHSCEIDLTQCYTRQLDATLWQRLLRFQEALHQIVVLGFLKHPQHGTISASIALENYLTAEEMDYEKKTVIRFSAIDFHRCFGIHAYEIQEAISPLIKRPRRKPYRLL